jgi:hypothetical protein
MGPNALINREVIGQLHGGDFTWSYLWSIDSMGLLYAHQAMAILISLCMCFGFLTRIVMPLAWFMTLMVCHRMTGFLFGLDQVVMMLAMYLMLAPAGTTMSVDAWLAHRKFFTTPPPDSMVTFATRLMQIHLCIVYLFGGLAKLRGEMWWDGTAMWFSAVAYEYQSLDLTWLGRFPVLGAILSHLTVFWETFYGVLVWPRWSRPWILGLAVMVHGGIALFLGMITFGVMMIVANMAFIEPAWFDDRLQRLRQPA